VSTVGNQPPIVKVDGFIRSSRTSKKQDRRQRIPPKLTVPFYARRPRIFPSRTITLGGFRQGASRDLHWLMADHPFGVGHYRCQGHRQPPSAGTWVHFEDTAKISFRPMRAESFPGQLRSVWRLGWKRSRGESSEINTRRFCRMRGSGMPKMKASVFPAHSPRNVGAQGVHEPEILDHGKSTAGIPR